MATSHFSGPVASANGFVGDLTGNVVGSVSGATTVVATNFDAGASGTAGSVDVFPTTASKGKIAVVATDSTGNTTTTITNAAQAGAVTYTIPDAGASANFVMSEGTATINGAKTFGTSITSTGAITPTGGIAASGGGSVLANLVHTGGAKATLSTDGTDITPVTTETYYAQVFVPANMTVTGVALFNGSAAVGNIRISMLTAAGVPIAAALTASTAMSGTDAYQRVPFAAPWAATGPATYFVALQHNNTSGRFNAHLFGDFIAGKKTGETYGTFTTVTVGTTFTASLGPYASLY